MAILTPQWQNWVVATETTWPAKSKFLHIALYKNFFPHPVLDCMLHEGAVLPVMFSAAFPAPRTLPGIE